MIRWEGCDLPPNPRLGRISGWEVGSIKPSSVALRPLSYSQNRLVCGFLKATASVPCICQSRGSFMCTEATCGCRCWPRVPRVLAGILRGRCSSGGQGRAGLARAELIWSTQPRRAPCVPQIRAAMAVPAEPPALLRPYNRRQIWRCLGRAGGCGPRFSDPRSPSRSLGPVCARTAPGGAAAGPAGHHAPPSGLPREGPAGPAASGGRAAGREAPGSAGNAREAPGAPARAGPAGGRLRSGSPWRSAPAPLRPRDPRTPRNPARSGLSPRRQLRRLGPRRHPRPADCDRPAPRTLQGPAGLSLRRRSAGMAQKQPQAGSRQCGNKAGSCCKGVQRRLLALGARSRVPGLRQPRARS